MSARERGGAPRLVTKAPTSPAQETADLSRFATESQGPSPVSQADAMGATIVAYLITGPILFGAVGWSIDRWLGLTGFVAVGIIGGMGLSLYTIWLRYGTSQAPPTDRPDAGLTRAAAPHNEENP